MVKLNEIINYLESTIKYVYGNFEGISIKYIKPSDEVDEYTLNWVSPSKKNKQEIVEQSFAKAILVDNSVQYSAKIKKQGKVLIIVDNPKREIAKIGNKFFVKKYDSVVHNSVRIHKEAKIGAKAHIGENSIIGKCTIGDDAVILPNVTINDGCIIGDNVFIKPNSALGYEGFGFEKDEMGKFIKFPQIGSLIIDDNVEIGAGTCIDKGSLSNTKIGKGTKINNLCHIAHNVVIGENVFIAAHINISGSSKIEDNVWIGPNATLRGHINVGAGATIGMGAVVTKNIPQGETWIGNPAKKMHR